MEAIVELIVALLVAFAQALIGLFQAVVTVLFMIAEFVFLALTKGMSAATRQYEQRTQDKLHKQESAEHAAAVATVTDTSVDGEAASIGLKQSLILASLFVFVVICGIAAWVAVDRLRKQRIAATRVQVKVLADTFAEQIKDNRVAKPTPGRLPDVDAWKQPIELFVDTALLGSLVVVRSSGPGRRSGSIDDILATRLIQAPAKDVGGELVNRGIKAMRERVGELIRGDDKEQLPDDLDIGEQ